MTDKILIIPQKGNETLKQYEFVKNSVLSIGRSSQCDIQFTDLRVSRNHMVLKIEPPHISIVQCQSVNQTFLIRGNQKAQVIQNCETKLQDQDIIRFVYPDETNCVASFQVIVILAPRCQHCEKILDENAIDGLCAACYAKLHPPKVAFAAPKPKVNSSHTSSSAFLLGKELEHSHTGIVYLIKQKDTGRLLTFKEINVNENNNSAMQILRREMRVAKQLRHPNILKIYGGGKLIDGLGWGVMTEYCSEGSLDKWMREKLHFSPNLGTRSSVSLNKPVMKEQDALAITISILNALEYAHNFPVYTLPSELREGYQNGIIHGNINPKNVLLQRQNDKLTVKLADFGLEKVFRAPSASAFSASDCRPATPPMVTTYFMSKEQFLHPNSLRSADDIFSAMTLLYYMLTGEYVRTYQNDSFAYFNGDIRPIRSLNQTISPALAAIIDSALNGAYTASDFTAVKLRKQLETYYYGHT